MPLETVRANSIRRRVVSLSTIIILIILIIATGNLSRQSEHLNQTQYDGNVRFDHAQYNLLADSLLKGNVSLDLEVSQDLANLSNPYSYGDRQQMIESNPDSFYYFDTAFYNSKYYCYFGVAPALLFYVPYKAITGCDLATTNLVIFLCCLFVPLSFLLIKELLTGNQSINKRLPLILVAFVFASNIFQLAFFPAFYAVPIISGLDFSLLGLLLWNKAAESIDLNKKYIFFGSLSMAIVFGCRPQLGIGSLTAFYLFKEPIKDGKIFNRRKPTTAIAAIGPYLVVFTGLGLYNYARFGNFLDFGSSYNLTGFDMTEYSQSWFLSISLILSYLFEPIKLSSSFPFIEGYSPVLGDLGSQNFAPNEPIPCGYFWLYPVVLIAIVFFLSKLEKRNKWPMIAMLSAALVVLIFDCRNAGISWRYFADFGWILAIASCWGISKNSSSNYSLDINQMKVVLVVTILLTTLITGFSLFSISVTRFNVTVSAGRPNLYAMVSNLFS